MIALILAAGKGTRLEPVTNNVPKPLIKVNNKTLLEHSLDALPAARKVIIVKNYLGDKIVEHIGATYKGKNIIYVTQDDSIYGTMGAVLAAKEHLDDNFLAICSDNIYLAEDLEKLVEIPDSYLVKKATKDEKSIFFPNAKSGIFKLASDGDANYYLDAGAWYLSKNFIKHPPSNTENDKEIGIPHTMRDIHEKKGIQYRPVYATTWYPVGTFEELDVLQKRHSMAISW